MAAKKAPAKKTRSVGSANAAEKRMMDNKKVTQSQFASPLKKGDIKSAMQARGRASQYGKPKGATVGGNTSDGRLGTKGQTAQTVVTSSRGNKFVVTEEKKQRRLRPDTIKTSVASAQFPSRKARDPKFGPAPKNKK